MLLFIETSYFTSIVKEYFSDKEYMGFQIYLAQHPLQGCVIRGTGGCRKIRYGAGGRGKRGGVRVIYYYRSKKGIIYLFDIYAKNEKSDLAPKERSILRSVIKEIEKQ